MSMSVVCPNCRFNFPSCLNLDPLNLLSRGTLNQCCENAEADRNKQSLLIPGNPNIPFTYVCRHWMQVPSTPCPHCCCSWKHRIKSFPKVGSCNQSEICKNHFVPSSTMPENSDSLCCGKESINDHSLIHCHQKNLISCPHLFEHVQLGNQVPCPVTNLWTKTDEYNVLSTVKVDLEECGWYYGSLSWQDANTMLTSRSEGSFLVRDSSSKKCPYALSVQTSQGPTSIRIEYEQGEFWLACEKKGVTPQFKGVIQLIEFYRALALTEGKDGYDHPSDHSSLDSNHVWLDHSGKIFSPIKIVRPLIKKPQTLQHLCRLAIKRSSFINGDESIPAPIRKFLKNYEFTL